MRTTIRLNEELGRRAKKYASRHEQTFTQVIEEALTQLLLNGGPAAPRKRTVLPTVGHSARKMSEAQYRAMIERMYAEEAQRIIGGGRASHRR